MADVFVSYKRSDRDKAEALADALRQESLSVWWDTDLATGEDWLRKIVREVNDAKCLIGVWTRACVDQDGFFRESDSSGHNFIRVEHERAGPKKVIGALFESDAMPLLYADRQCARLLDWNFSDRKFPEFRKLVDAITARSRPSEGTAASVFQTAAPSPFHDTEKIMSSLQSHRSGEWTIAEASLFVLVSAGLASDMTFAQERNEVFDIASKSRSLRMLSMNQLAQTSATIMERARSRPDTLSEACKALPQDLRLSIFGHCVDILLTDGGLQPVGAEYLNRIIALLEIDRDEAQSMIEALLIKSRF